jgi:hypothetical protein
MMALAVHATYDISSLLCISDVIQNHTKAGTIVQSSALKVSLRFSLAVNLAVTAAIANTPKVIDKATGVEAGAMKAFARTASTGDSARI